ncbi:hypothetical protein HOY82DRAFT_304969 [Tuber indicum]|nr:hypothetical protein HOY82DRAFT_304969 [Tuber indicum]
MWWVVILGVFGSRGRGGSFCVPVRLLPFKSIMYVFGRFDALGVPWPMGIVKRKFRGISAGSEEFFFFFFFDFFMLFEG